MKNTYTGTWLYPTNLKDATFVLYITNAVKYEAMDEEETMIEYTGVTSWDLIKGGDEAEAIEAETDAASVDENHEYLVLHFEDGTTSTFRNSHVDAFIR